MSLGKALFLSYEESDLSGILKIEENRIDPWSETQITAQLKDGGDNFVLRLNGQCIAYSFFQTVLDQADLLLIVVDEKYRRHGYAEILLKKSMMTLRNRKTSTFYLDVRESNLAAIGLYKKIGFEENGRRKNYYPHLHTHEEKKRNTEQVCLSGEDALLMHYID